MTRRPPIGLVFLLLVLATAGQAAPTAATVQALDATIARCFELRSQEPAAAITLAESTLASGALPVEAEIKLQACLARAAAVVGDVPRTDGAAKRIDALLAEHPMSPEFSLRALSNAGAALHMVGRIHEALDLYVRAYEVAAQDESEVAQVATLINVGSIYSEEIGAHAEAEGYFRQAEAIEFGISGRDPLLPYNRGLNYLRMGRTEEALASFIEAESRGHAEGHEVVGKRAEAELVALRARGDDNIAARQTLEGIAEAQLSQQDPSGAAITRLRMSRLALDAGDADAALQQALAAKAAVSDGVFRNEVREALQAEVTARSALGQWAQAYAGAETLRQLEVERLRGQQLASLAGLQARLQDTRSEQELARLHDERRLEALRLAHAKRIRNGAIAAFCLLALLAAAFFFYQRRVNRKLRRLSTVDSLTGLLNRRAGEASLREAEKASETGDRRSAVFLIDIDNFKDFNDRFGHTAGDAILTTTAARLRAGCRPGDTVSRWGGEEFLVVCRDLDADLACKVAERLRTSASSSVPVTESGDAEPVSVSIGFAALPFFTDAAKPDGWQASVSLADRALYAAKHSGRDTWVGLWGAKGNKASLASVLDDPEAHARQGSLRILAQDLDIRWPDLPR